MPGVDNAPIVIRMAKTTDRNYVIKTWLMEHKGQWFGKRLNTKVYEGAHNRLLNRLYDRCVVEIAGWDEDPDTILGFSITSHNSIHYVFVREEFRRQGIASTLLASFADRPVVIYTHPFGKSFKAEPPRDLAPESWVYDPYHAFELAYTQSASVPRITESASYGVSQR